MKTVHSVISLSFLIILLLVTPVNGSSDWEEFWRSNDGSIHSYNKIHVKKRTNDIVQVWIGVNFSEQGREIYMKTLKTKGLSTEGYENLTNIRSLIEIDCKKKKIQILRMVYFKTDGIIINSHKIDRPNWDNIGSDELWEVLRKKVCVKSSSDWVLLDKTDIGDIHSYNNTSIKRRTKNIVQVWTEIVYSINGRETLLQKMRNGGLSTTKEWDKLSHSQTLVEIDCKKGMSQLLSLGFYDMDGNVLKSELTDKPNWEYIVHGSIQDNLRKIVCKQPKLKGSR